MTSQATRRVVVVGGGIAGLSTAHALLARRPELDHALVRKAEEAGVRYVDRVTLTAAEELPDRMVLSGTHDGAPCRFEARLVLDATGPRGFLHRALSLPEVPFRRHAPTQTLFSHFRGVRRLETMEPFDRFPSPPFPPDDAAVPLAS